MHDFTSCLDTLYRARYQIESIVLCHVGGPRSLAPTLVHPSIAMKPHALTIVIASLLSLPAVVCAAEPNPEIAGLEKTAAAFVTAYNQKNAEAIAQLFVEQGELTDLTGELTTTGHAQIQAKYADLFSDEKSPTLAIEVASVRLITPTVAIEDGTYHLDLPGDDQTVRSFAYSAVMLKNDSGEWKIGSSRTLKEITDAAGQLAELAAAIKGNWSGSKDGTHFDLTYGWDDSGKFLIGDLAVTKPDSEPQSTQIRIGWDGARKTITWWTFDSAGGSAKGDWTAVDDTWLVHSEGTTADGEKTSSNGELSFDGKDTMIWKASERLVDGEKLPDNLLHLIRQTTPATEE